MILPRVSRSFAHCCGLGCSFLWEPVNSWRGAAAIYRALAAFLAKLHRCSMQPKQARRLRRFWHLRTPFGGLLAAVMHILAVSAENRQIWRHFPPKPAKTPKKKTSRSEELPGHYRRQRSVLCCSWVVLVCRMATIPPDVFLTLSAHPPELAQVLLMV
jgi:hypothetical protein